MAMNLQSTQGLVDGISRKWCSTAAAASQRHFGVEQAQKWDSMAYSQWKHPGSTA